MNRTRMLTPGFRLFGGTAFFLFVAAFMFGISTEIQVDGSTAREVLDAKGVISTVTGPMTLGWKGGVGNHMGYAVLLAGAAAAALIAGVLIAFRDADPQAEAEVLHVAAVPRTRAPAGASYAPIIGVFAVALIGIGWVVNTAAMWAGLGLLAIDAIMWSIRAWAERATGDDEVNYLVYKKIVDPIRVPVVAVACIGFLVFGLSRVLLAVPNKNASSFIFGGVGVLFFAVLLVLAVFPKASKPLITILLVVGGLAVLGGMIWGVAAGTRPVEHETEGTGSHEGTGTGEGGAKPAGQHEGSLAPARITVTIPTGVDA